MLRGRELRPLRSLELGCQNATLNSNHERSSKGQKRNGCKTEASLVYGDREQSRLRIESLITHTKYAAQTLFPAAVPARTIPGSLATTLSQNPDFPFGRVVTPLFGSAEFQPRKFRNLVTVVADKQDCKPLTSLTKHAGSSEPLVPRCWVSIAS